MAIAHGKDAIMTMTATGVKYDYDEDTAEELGELMLTIQDEVIASISPTGFAYADPRRKRAEENITTEIRNVYPRDAKPGDIRRALYYAEYWNAHTAVKAVSDLYGLKHEDWSDYAYEA